MQAIGESNRMTLLFRKPTAYPYAASFLCSGPRGRCLYRNKDQALLNEFSAILLTAKLAGITTAVLLIFATPLAWWLAHSRHRLKPAVEALTALPLVMPPTVLGFYLLLLFSPDNPFGGLGSSYRHRFVIFV